ncbi:transglutaminaseTgpA domain-containing protein [Microbacterium sp.]|uniref:transglutaminase family protein n=1 Tax=Microbacterium sp. TaxID=51671 RepID=UPI0039E4E0D5
MSRAEPRAPHLRWHRDEAPREVFFVPAVLATASALVALWPYTSVIEPGAWSFTAVVMVCAVALIGFGVRVALRYRRVWAREVVALVAQLLGALGLLTQLVAPSSAVLGVVPTDATWTSFAALSGTGWDQIIHGVAPLDSTPGLRLLLGAGFAAVTLLLDQLIATRGAVLAGLLVAGVGVVPMAVVGSGVNIVWFLMLAVIVLILLRCTALRHPESPGRLAPVAVVSAGAVAIAASLFISPALPVAATLAGVGPGVRVDASLRLGDDLRQPSPVEVLALATARTTAPYLRLTTLSDFDGRVWSPDRSALQPTSDGFGAAEWGPDIAVAEESTSIRVTRMSSSWLPVPYPATSVQGVGSSWRVMPENRTLASRTADAVGNDYTVASLRVTPTLEQIRNLPAAPASDGGDPVELPASIASTAAAVTAAATNDYDRLIALQSWFRSEFAYSLETPVEEGFDGTGADAVATFLEVRSGYCVHFAGAFTLMAQSLGMQSRIVVGYLPGTRTSERRGDEYIYSVASDKLHSWPEVLFPGVGWVPFEPTATLGTPTAFASEQASGGTAGQATPAPTSVPTSTATSPAEIDRGDVGGGTTSGGELRRLDPAPVVLVGFGIALVLLLPMLIRWTVRVLRIRRARRGDAGAAWAELRATLIDLQIAISDADSPRIRGTLLVRENSADAAATAMLVDAVERASYARAGSADDLSPALRTVLRGVRRSVDRRARAAALLLPRSLIASRPVGRVDIEPDPEWFGELVGDGKADRR